MTGRTPSIFATLSRLRAPGLAACCAGLALLLGLTGCGEPERGPAPQLPPIEGNVYEARIFGFSIEKPDAWSFRPETALKEDTEAPIDDAEEMWRRLHTGNPGVPLVSMTPEPGSDPYTGPVVEVAAIPLRKKDSTVLGSVALSAPEDILDSRIGERARFPDFEVLEKAAPVEIGGVQAAVTRLRYRLKGEDGEEKPVEEFIWFLRRERIFFYINQRGLAPLDPDVEEIFRRVAHSVRLAS